MNRALDALGAFLLALMVALLAWRSTVGAQAVREAGETTMILGLPMWLSYAALAPGLALQGLRQAGRQVGQRRVGPFRPVLHAGVDRQHLRLPAGVHRLAAGPQSLLRR
eukprot:gene43735-54347_t